MTTDVSGKLGEYMLKGWILTDRSCPKLGCHIPLMRSPNGITPTTHYCANCDDNKTSRSVISLPSEQAQTSPSISSYSHHSRSSTPPTEFSSTLSSPIFAPPIETPESLRRRQQSDTASSEIGKRLLKGWAMLAEECPNVECFGVPLVRPPMTGGGKDPRKECVICGIVYIIENDASGWERLVPTNPVVPEQADIVSASSSGLEGPSGFRNEEKTAVRNESQTSKLAMPLTAHKSYELKFPSLQDASTMQSIVQTNTAASALAIAATSLELALYTLSERMTFLSSGQSPLDPASITLTAEAIRKVAEALAQVKQPHWSEPRLCS